MIFPLFSIVINPLFVVTSNPDISVPDSFVTVLYSNPVKLVIVFPDLSV